MELKSLACKPIMRVSLFFAMMAIALIVGVPYARAVEVPPELNPTYMQTNGPDASIDNGDWYTASTAQGSAGGYDYFKINIPCGWPANLDVHVDLWSPWMNTNPAVFNAGPGNTGTYDEVREGAHTADNTVFELYGVSTTIVQPNQPGPGAAGSLHQQVYTPRDAGAGDGWDRFYTLTHPVTCGSYVLRSESLGRNQNGWRLRVGNFPAGPNGTPPANYDNPDGLPGTNDEITVGIIQASYQNDVAGQNTCLTLYQYVAPGQASVSFHNFDLDNPSLGAQRVRYYAPSAAYDPNGLTGGIAGTASGSTLWNNGTFNAGPPPVIGRGTGDVVNNPEAGWWRMVSCVSFHNQYIQEGQFSQPLYYQQPPTPKMIVSKTDGVTVAGANNVLNYTVTFTNTSSGPTAGAATNVTLTDVIPPNTTYQNCGINSPYMGTCSYNGATRSVAFTLNGWVNAGASGSVRVTVVTNSNIPPGSFTNTVTLSYKDPLKNAFSQVTATDTDVVVGKQQVAQQNSTRDAPAEVPEADTLVLLGSGGIAYVAYLLARWRSRRRVS